MSQVCFDSTSFYVFVFIGVLIMAFTLVQPNLGTDDRSVVQPRSARDEENDDLDSRLRDQMRMGLIIDQSRRVDLERFMHPLTPPRRRGIGNLGSIVPIGVPTRGEYGPFHMMGYLHNNADADQAMPLMGRRIHSNQYEYYTFHHNNPTIKIPIKLSKEIQDGENITITSYPGANFRAAIYDIDLPRYVPY